MYTTIQNVRNKVTTTLTDTELEVLIGVVTRYIDNYLGYKLASDTVQDLLVDGSGTDSLMFRQPIYQFSSLEKTAPNSSVTLEADTYVAYPLNTPYKTYFRLYRGCFSQDKAGYTIKDAGIGRFTIANLPSDIVDIATQVTAKLVTSNGISLASESSTSGVKTSETIGGYSVSYSAVTSNTDVDQSFKSSITASLVLDAYKLAPVIV